MTDQQWPAEAREAAVLAALSSMTETGVTPSRTYCEATVDAVLDALAPHVVPRARQTEEWEWGTRRADGEVLLWTSGELTARLHEQADCGPAVRRRPGTAPGPWEVDPDA